MISSEAERLRRFFKLSYARRNDLGLVLSGGGTRTAYQVGVLKALQAHVDPRALEPAVVVGSSIGAVNGLMLSAALKESLAAAISELERMWLERTFANTFRGGVSRTFLRSLQVAFLRFRSPGPVATDASIFDPTPLMDILDARIRHYGGLSLAKRHYRLNSVAVMTTVEGNQRKPLLFVSAHKRIDSSIASGSSYRVVYVDELSARHGFASAALPSVLPPIDIDVDDERIRLVDGGISNNIPIDPAVRLGARRVLSIDASGREWWFERAGTPNDTRPEWEVPADDQSFCHTPGDLIVVKNTEGFGPILKDAVSKSSKNLVEALGPTWPIFLLLKRKLGEEVTFEIMTYVALHRDFVEGLIARGYEDGLKALKRRGIIPPD